MRPVPILKKHQSIARVSIFLVLAALVGGMVGCGSLEEEAIHFADPNLEVAVREAISVPEGPLYPSDLEGHLYAARRNIADLTGLEYCSNLTSLDLWRNQINDVSPLANLTNLTVTTLAVVSMAFIMRLMRSSMLESLGKGYVLTARAKGLDERTVIGKHARRNALIPVITVSGYVFAGLANGVVITETLFTYKGIGWLAWQAAVNLDIASVLGFALFNAGLFVLVNLVVDVLYTRVDPRVRLGGSVQ